MSRVENETKKKTPPCNNFSRNATYRLIWRLLEGKSGEMQMAARPCRGPERRQPSLLSAAALRGASWGLGGQAGREGGWGLPPRAAPSAGWGCPKSAVMKGSGEARPSRRAKREKQALLLTAEIRFNFTCSFGTRRAETAFFLPCFSFLPHPLCNRLKFPLRTS